MNTTLLPRATLDAWLAAHGHWRLDDTGLALTRRFAFADFTHAFAFMAGVALVAERLGHHPEWSNVYDRVDVRLTTHDAGGLTASDLMLAELMEPYAGAAQ